MSTIYAYRTYGNLYLEWPGLSGRLDRHEGVRFKLESAKWVPEERVQGRWLTFEQVIAIEAEAWRRSRILPTWP